MQIRLYTKQSVNLTLKSVAPYRHWNSVTLLNSLRWFNTWEFAVCFFTCQAHSIEQLRLGVYQFANYKTACKLHVHNMQLQNGKHMFAIVINEQHPFDDNLRPGIFYCKNTLDSTTCSCSLFSITKLHFVVSYRQVGNQVTSIPPIVSPEIGCVRFKWMEWQAWELNVILNVTLFLTQMDRRPQSIKLHFRCQRITRMPDFPLGSVSVSLQLLSLLDLQLHQSNFRCS